MPVYAVFGLVCCIATHQTTSSKDGIYLCQRDGNGEHVRRNDGVECTLGKRLTGSLGKAKLISTTNDNSRFLFNLTDVGPIPEEQIRLPLAVVIGDTCLAATAYSPQADARLQLSCIVNGAAVADQLADHLKIPCTRRKHPGHRFHVCWTPTKASYAPGETVALKLDIRNVGDRPFSFRVGGQQRGPRDNQFRFIAYRGAGAGRAVPDVGDPTNFGGLSTTRTIEPGGTFSTSLALDKWFVFAEPDTYRITGLFQLELQDQGEHGRAHHAIWDDMAVGEVDIKVTRESQ